MRWLDPVRWRALDGSRAEPVSRSMNESISETGSLRWIPLVETEDQEGVARAWPASLWVEAHPPAPARCFGGGSVWRPGIPIKTWWWLFCARRCSGSDGLLVLPAAVTPVVFEGGHHLDHRRNSLHARRVAARQ